MTVVRMLVELEGDLETVMLNLFQYQDDFHFRMTAVQMLVEMAWF